MKNGMTRIVHEHITQSFIMKAESMKEIESHNVSQMLFILSVHTHTYICSSSGKKLLMVSSDFKPLRSIIFAHFNPFTVK